MFLNNNRRMPIVSISLTEEILREIDALQKNLGFSGRSDAIRAGIRSFVSEEKQKENLSGNVNAILLVCLLYTSPSPRDLSTSRMPSSA